MSRFASIRVLLACSLLTLMFTGCSRDPNVRKQKYLDSGEKYAAEGKYREAAIQFRNAILIDSRFAQAHYDLSQAYLKLGDSNDAYQELNRTVELAPDNYRAHTDLANLLIGTRNPEYLKKAEPDLKILREKQPNRPETHEAWANYDSAQNNIADAMREMQQAVALDPSRSESYLLLAIFQLRADLPDQAEANFKKATEVEP